MRARVQGAGRSEMPPSRRGRKRTSRGPVTRQGVPTPSCDMRGSMCSDATVRGMVRGARGRDTPHRFGSLTLNLGSGRTAAWQPRSLVRHLRESATRIPCEYRASTWTTMWPSRSAWATQTSTPTSRRCSRRSTTCPYLPGQNLLCAGRISTNYRSGPDRPQTCEKRPVSLAAVGRSSTRYSTRRNFDRGSRRGSPAPSQKEASTTMVTRNAGSESSASASAWRGCSLLMPIPGPHVMVRGGGVLG